MVYALDIILMVYAQIRKRLRGGGGVEFEYATFTTHCPWHAPSLPSDLMASTTTYGELF